MEESTEAKTAPYPGYRTLWIWLALGWVASGVDRTITGPVTTYMIDNKVPLLQGVENPFAVGGLVGSLSTPEPASSASPPAGGWPTTPSGRVGVASRCSCRSP